MGIYSKCIYYTTALLLFLIGFIYTSAYCYDLKGLAKIALRIFLWKYISNILANAVLFGIPTVVKQNL